MLRTWLLISGLWPVSLQIRPATNQAAIHNFCIICWFPAHQKSILEIQVTKTTLTLTLNYRGITVTAIFGKLFEYALLHKLSIAQSELQFGFTEGLSPSMAVLLISEAKAESQVNKTHVYVATLDSMKAFDVVHHAILLDKLTQTNIHDTSWLVIRDLYQQISAKVKLLGGLSDSFPIGQGVPQGAILSTSLYKVYIDELLRILKSKRLGLRIGTVYIGCPTCADDIALLALTPEELQIMIHEALNYSKKNRYQIHPTKSNVVDISIYKLNEDLKWFLGENPIRLSERAIHLGITRAGKGESVFNVNDRISLARRTSYSLMNTGLHGTNGLSPEASYVIYRAYVLPAYRVFFMDLRYLVSLRVSWTYYPDIINKLYVIYSHYHNVQPALQCICS